MAASQVEKLQQAGVIATPHQISPEDVNAINGLNDSEVDTLISVKNKLGDDFFKKTAEGGQFPHVGTVSF